MKTYSNINPTNINLPNINLPNINLLSDAESVYAGYSASARDYLRSLRNLVFKTTSETKIAVKAC